MKQKKNIGKVIIPADTKPWPHELRAASLLASHGHTVEFIGASNIAKTADFIIDGTTFELKSPVSKNISAVERNLKRATKQSCNIVFDSSRMKSVRDSKVRSVLVAKAKEQVSIKRLIYINKSGEIRVLK